MITLVIPHLPKRADLLQRALVSVGAQTRRPDDVIVEPDPLGTGAAATRNRALGRVTTDLVGFLDDDDELLPNHLELLEAELLISGADLVHSDFEVVGGQDHRPSFVQVTNLTRTEVVRSVGGFPQPCSASWPYAWEDWGLLAKLLLAGATFRKVHEVTWRYHIHSGNSVEETLWLGGYHPEQVRLPTEQQVGIDG